MKDELLELESRIEDLEEIVSELEIENEDLNFRLQDLEKEIGVLKEGSNIITREIHHHYPAPLYVHSPSIGPTFTCSTTGNALTSGTAGTHWC